MYKAMKALAIVVLVATIAGAGAVLYAIRTMAPVVEQITVTATPAGQAQDMFDTVMRQMDEGTFSGRVYAQADELDAKDCTFLTYHVRLKNRGFFPAEWVSLGFVPREDVQNLTRDYLQLDNFGANVLAAGSEGDISTTILTTIDPANTVARIEVTCHVFGQTMTLTHDVE